MGVSASYSVGEIAVGQSSVLAVRPGVNSVRPRAIPIILSAGRGATAWQMLADPYTGHFVRPLVEAGYPVLCLAPGGSASWGSASAMSAIDSGREWLGSRLGVRTDVCVVGGFSMGGLASLNYARMNQNEVIACAPICPAVDIVTLHDTNGSYATEIEAAYGGSSWSSNSQAYDPTRNAHPPSIPTKMWFSSNDTSALSATQSAWAAANPSVATVSLGATGHSPFAVGSEEYLSFIKDNT